MLSKIVKMFTSSTRTIISILVTLQALAYVAAQVTQLTDETGTYNVSTKADDYIKDNRSLYNATLQNFLDQINDINTRLSNEVTPLSKQFDLLLKQIQETNERILPLERLNGQSEFCVQKYKAELPNADIVSAKVQSCFTAQTGAYASIVAQLNLLYGNLVNYYNVDHTNALIACGRTFRNPSINYTNCVIPIVSRTNVVTNNQRTSFATALQAAECAVSARTDTTVACANTQFSSTLLAMGAAERLINDCISGVSGQKPCTTLSAGCSNVKYLPVKDSDFTSVNITNPLQGLTRAQDCIELRYTY